MSMAHLVLAGCLRSPPLRRCCLRCVACGAYCSFVVGACDWCMRLWVRLCICPDCCWLRI